MGILSWWKGNPTTSSTTTTEPQNPKPVTKLDAKQAVEVPGMNGAMEITRPAAEVTVFEFGSVAASTDKVTLAGFCPVSDDLEPCRWEILPASGDEAPQFRVVF